MNHTPSPGGNGGGNASWPGFDPWNMTPSPPQGGFDPRNVNASTPQGNGGGNASWPGFDPWNMTPTPPRGGVDPRNGTPVGNGGGYNYYSPGFMENTSSRFTLTLPSIPYNETRTPPPRENGGQGNESLMSPASIPWNVTQTPPLPPPSAGTTGGPCTPPPGLMANRSLSTPPSVPLNETRTPPPRENGGYLDDSLMSPPQSPASVPLNVTQTPPPPSPSAVAVGGPRTPPQEQPAGAAGGPCTPPQEPPAGAAGGPCTPPQEPPAGAAGPPCTPAAAAAANRSNQWPNNISPIAFHDVSIGGLYAQVEAENVDYAPVNVSILRRRVISNTNSRVCEMLKRFTVVSIFNCDN